ncbi:MAG TPA: hypothetical protein VGL80_29515 [Pseudonocardiaceae bacterium]|jgi:hypothetical protein
MEILISNLVAALALLLSGLSWWIGRRGLRNTSYSDTTTMVLDVDRMLVEYPHLRPYFFDNQELPGKDEPEYHRVLAAADLFLDVAEHIWHHHVEYVPADAIGWREWIHELFQNSPALREIMRAQPFLYPALTDVLDNEPCNQSGHELALGFRRGTVSQPAKGVAAAG